MIYQIRVKGHLAAQQWTDWFQELTITLEESGEMLLTGPIADQAALHGLLKKVRDLGMPLLSVSRLESDQTDTTGTERLGDSSSEQNGREGVQREG